VVLTGGVARNPAARHFLSVALDREVIVPEYPQITGAYGAALLAREHEAGPAATEADIDQPSRVAHTEPGHSCAECDGRPSAIVELGPVIGVRSR
jgi:sugar (pentulose or hexulose) kinase